MFFKILQNSQENTGACIFIKKGTLAEVFSSEFCEILKSIYFKEHLPMAVFVDNFEQT